MATTTALREALNEGISSGNLVDTKIILYSHRDSSGRVCRPKALYTSSHVLKAVSYFDELLFGNFVESQPKDLKEAIDDDECAEDYGYLSDSDLEDCEDEKDSSPKPTTKLKGHPFDLSGNNKVVCEGYEEGVEKGKVVKIPDIAFVTFQAFLVYLYTDVMVFSPFGSKQNRRSRSSEFNNPADDKIPSPSPKSIFRLADKYDVPGLKTLALNRIRSELTKCDIVEESFSRFASQYGEIRDLYVQQLAYIWVEDSTEATRTNVEKKIDDFVEGDLEHAAESVAALWKMINGDGEVRSPSNTSPTVVQVKSPAHWDSVKMAFIKSIRTGVFFDRKYWARHSASGDLLRPVYFSSTVMDDKREQLNKLVKYLICQSHSTNDFEGDGSAESDCEGGPSGGDERTSRTNGKEEQVRAVLITGSFSAWKSLFFYRCTDEILFAPLKSQGAESRMKYIREKTIKNAPPPCSPKSIYILANLLEIKPLCDIALADIKGKVTLDNVVEEVFSRATATQEKIMEIESELFIPNLKDPRLIGLVSKNIGRTSNGSSAHTGGALKLGLKKAVELKRQSQCAQLRCSRGGCAWSNPVPYSSVGGNVYCSHCGGYWLMCTGCGCQRTSTYTSCQRCGKRFV